MFSFQTPIYSTRAWIKTTPQSISHILIYNFPSVDNHHWDCSGLLFGYIQSEHLRVSKYIKALTSVWPLQPLHTAVMRGRAQTTTITFGLMCRCPQEVPALVRMITQWRIRREVTGLQLKPCRTAWLYSWDQHFDLRPRSNLRNTQHTDQIKKMFQVNWFLLCVWPPWHCRLPCFS